MSLRDIRLKYEYRSDQSNLVGQFYVPCFTESVEYRRAVGYFTSRGLVLAAQGLAVFLQKGGRMRLVASPLLDPEDVEALKQGYQARSSVVERAVLRQLGAEFLDCLSDTARTRLGCLSWLIAEGRLDVRIAMPSPDLIIGGQAIYHEKIGIFRDSEGNVVAFTGSPNETVGGLVSNFESIDVYFSWDDPHGRTERKVDNFERLWENKTPRLETLDFPKAAERKLLALRPSRRPESDPESVGSPPGQETPEGTVIHAVPDFKPPDDLVLYSHQCAAIAAWNATEGKCGHARRTGFLEMATGSGKTITALSIAAGLYSELGRLAVVVVVPTKVLVDQWAAQVELFGLVPVTAHSDSPSWRKDAWSAVRAYRRGHVDVTLIITTNASFATKDCRELMSEFGGPFLLIADEAHNLGATRTLEYLPPEAEYRLALSATPRRYFDEKGTEALFDYFGESVYQFTLSQAIGVCLTPYDYFVTPVELTQDEMARYRALTARIRRFRAARENSEDDPRLAQLYIQRARIIGDAEGKIDALSSLLGDRVPRNTRHVFVYTSDKNPEQTSQVLRLLQEDKRMLVHQFTEKESSDRKLREELLRRFSIGDDLQVLVAKRCLDEGVDIPPARWGYFLASTTNPRQYVQRRGRLLRRFPGKSHAVIHDLLVIPPTGGEAIDSDDRSEAIVSEFRRVVEFASTARNGATARVSILDIARQCGVLDILAGGGA